jgi:hypothetical protein
MSMFESNVREGNESFFGFNTVSDTAVLTTGNAIVGFDFGAPTVSANMAHVCLFFD